MGHEGNRPPLFPQKRPFAEQGDAFLWSTNTQHFLSLRLSSFSYYTAQTTRAHP